MKKITLKISGMHCTSCAMSIDGDVEDFVKGVKSVRTSFAKQKCEVEFDEKLASVETIINQIKETGYTANEV